MDDKKVTYKGKDFFIGLPARDMTLTEWREYPKELTEAAMKAGLYQIMKISEVKTNE